MILNINNCCYCEIMLLSCILWLDLEAIQIYYVCSFCYTSFCFLTKVLFSCSCNPLVKYFITTCLSFRVSWMPWQIFFDEVSEVSEGACQVAALPPSSVWLISKTSP